MEDAYTGCPSAGPSPRGTPQRLGASLRRSSAAAVAVSTLSIVKPTRPSRAMLSTQVTNLTLTIADTSPVIVNRTKRPVLSKTAFFTAVIATILKIKAPTNVERAFCEESSATISAKDLGVAVLLAEA